MIRKSPRGNLPQSHPTAFVDPTAMLCGLMRIEELMHELSHSPEAAS